MARFVKLIHIDGHPIYVNPDHVVCARPSADPDDLHTCKLTLDNGDYFVVKGADVPERLQGAPIDG